jgi:hypothetical protein
MSSLVWMIKIILLAIRMPGFCAFSGIFKAGWDLPLLQRSTFPWAMTFDRWEGPILSAHSSVMS